MAEILEDPKNTNKGTGYVVRDVEDRDHQDRPPPPHPGFDTGEVIADDGHIVTQHERLSLMRGLSQRHVQMIAIAGAIVGADLQGLINFVHWLAQVTNVLFDVGYRLVFGSRWLHRYWWSTGCAARLCLCGFGGLRYPIRSR